jgi:hypothetical protein
MWLVIDLALLALFEIAALVHLYRRRDSMEKREVVKWSLLIVLVPFVGVLAYFFSLLDKAVQRGTPGRRDEAAPFLQRPGGDR